MEMTGEAGSLAVATELIAVMICESIVQCYGAYGGDEGRAYRSMSWSTSSRERAKLGRLDSEPPLLLREWPPETGRDRGGQIQANRGERRGQKSGSPNKQIQQ